MSETKKNVGNMVTGGHPAAELIGGLVMTFLSLLLLLLVGEYLWNRVLAKVVTVVKPVTSVWQILGLVLLSKLIFC
jgi:hypothetical protein